MQIKRIAKARGLDERRVGELVAKCTQGPLWGMFGPSAVNVLKLNLALDELKKP